MLEDDAVIVSYNMLAQVSSTKKKQLETANPVFKLLFFRQAYLLLQSAMQFLHAINIQIIQTLHAFAHRFAAGNGGVLRHALGQ